MKILLMGSPNVGKSAIFSRLTGTHVVASNYPGTTVGFTKGSLTLDGEVHEVVDVPGAYTLDPTNKAEEVAVDMLAEGDLVINVIDSTNLERNLQLTLELIEAKKPMLLVLNMWDEALEHGIDIDAEELSRMLGIPVVTTCALSGEGIKSITDKLSDAVVSSLESDPDKKWKTIGKVVEGVQVLEHRHPTWKQKFSHASVHPIIGPFIALLVLFLSFSFIAYVGETLHLTIELGFETFWLPVTERISSLLGGGGFLHGILIGDLIEGNVELELSFGLLTTGLFIPIVVILPYIFCFYFILSLLEDIGYLPRLGVLVDTFMHRVGLHGLSIVPMMLGLGCNVPGVLAGRVLETRKERFIALTLVSICVPCMAQIAMVSGLLGSVHHGLVTTYIRGVGHVQGVMTAHLADELLAEWPSAFSHRPGIIGMTVIVGTLLFLWVSMGVAMKFMLKGETPEILAEIPPYRMPYWRSLLRKVYLRLQCFIKEALPYVLLGVFIVQILYMVGVIDLLDRVFSPFVQTMFGLPGNAVGALIVGFLRKDVAVGMLGYLALDLRELIVASVILIIYFPCVATFVILYKELGLVDTIKSACIMVLVAVTVGTGLNFTLQAFGM